jgi:NAD(P)-dependent dehydrogenase (short-subunit alcohol dehydrogenase family)
MANPSPVKTYHREAYPAILATRPELSTKGKSVLITGAGSGIGAAIAERYAASGASVIGLVGRTAASLDNTRNAVLAAHADAKVYAIAGDITSESSIKEAVKEFASHTANGTIDILVANAGYLPSVADIDNTDASDWWRGFDINVRGNFNLLRAYVPYAPKEDAVVIHTSTAMVHLPTFRGSTGYQASKLAATKVFEGFRAEHPQIRVVQFHPGVIETDMLGKFASTAGSTEGLPSSDKSEFRREPVSLITAC